MLVYVTQTKVRNAFHVVVTFLPKLAVFSAGEMGWKTEQVVTSNVRITWMDLCILRYGAV